MSDGVWKYVGYPRIREVLQNERGAAVIECLERAARMPGNGQFQDDFTAVILECG